MRRTVSNLLVIGSQLLIVGLFFVTVFNDDIMLEKHVSTVHNNNLNKIATSVSLLFEEEKIVEIDEKLDDMTLEELPSIETIKEDTEEIISNTEEDTKKESTLLTSIDASKYISNEEMGFKVTEGNKTYSLSDNEFTILANVVSCEAKDGSIDDALAVTSVILNRSEKHGISPYNEIQSGFSCWGTSKVASSSVRNAVSDAIYNGIRNNNYTGFRSSGSTSYSSNQIVAGGNRYGQW